MAFSERYPERYFDVAIAEQHAVTLAAGMACEGMKPVVAIYSTFLQRAYDQLIHDVAVQHLDVLFAIDRAGLVGEADFFNGYDRDACPRCGSPAIEGNGRDANGVRRWRCLSCGRAFNPATGTVFDGRKLPVADWTEFLLEVFSYGSLAGAARSGRRSATTPPYWLAKLLAVLEGVQEGAVLAGRVEIDEMMYPLPLCLLYTSDAADE